MLKYTISLVCASAFALGTFVFGTTGCISETDSSSEYSPPDGGLPDAPIEPINHCLNGQPDDGEMGVDCGGTCAGCGDGAPCVTDSDCAHGACIAQNGVEFGACYGPELVGCINAAVSPSAGLCSTVENRLLVCAPGDTTADASACKNAGTGEHGEVYFCCAR